MVIGALKIGCITKVKNNPFYGDYEVKTELNKTIVNEKCEGLEYPKYGIVIRFNNCDSSDLIFSIDRHYFTGEPVDEECDEFSTSFCFDGHVYEVMVDYNGELKYVNEWYHLGDFEDGTEPDNHYTSDMNNVECEILIK